MERIQRFRAQKVESIFFVQANKNSTKLIFPTKKKFVCRDKRKISSILRSWVRNLQTLIHKTTGPDDEPEERIFTGRPNCFENNPFPFHCFISPTNDNGN